MSRIVVIGAGPAGLRTVECLAEAGLRPILIDESRRPGGQIYRQPPNGVPDAARLYGFEASKATALHALLARLGDRVEYRPDTLVWAIEGKRLSLLTGGNQHSFIEADALVLTTGAMDRILPFPGWTLPGVYTLGAAQIALKSQGVAIGRRVALVGAGPLLPLVTHQYRKAGAELVLSLDVTGLAPKLVLAGAMLANPKTVAKGLFYLARNALGGVPQRFGAKSLQAIGDGRVEGLVWQDNAGRSHTIACDAIGVSFGLRSEIQLADLAGCAMAFDPLTRQWQPERSPEGRSSVAGVYLAGDGAVIGGADVAELAGPRTALTVLADLGHKVDPARLAHLDSALARQRRFRVALEHAYPFPAALLDTLDDAEILCRCEGITVGTLRAAVRGRDVTEINRLKALTRIGMGRCQGRVCGQAAAELLARERAVEVEAVGRLRSNPPVKPVPLQAPLAASEDAA